MGARAIVVGSMLATLVVLVLAAVPAGAAQQGSIAGRWALDVLDGDPEAVLTTPDASGNGLTGTTLGAFLEPGRFGSAATFVGSSAAVTVPAAPQLEPAQVTLMAWVRRSTPGGPYEYIAAKGAQAPCDAASYGLYTGDNGGLQFYITRGAGKNPVFSPERAAASIWNGAWHGVAGVFDGTRVRLYVDGEEIGVGAVAPSGIGYGLSDGQFTIGNYARQQPCAAPTRFGGLVDEVRVYDRALGPAELQTLLTAEGPTPPGLPVEVPPAPVPPAGGTPPPSSPGGSSGPRVSAVTAATPVVAGGRAVLSAAVSGTADRLEWDLNADGKTDATCPGSQTTLTFRVASSAAGAARQASAFGATATVRAVTGGSVSTFTQSLNPARGAAVASAALGRVVDAFTKAPPVFVCGLAKDLAQATAQQAPRPFGGAAGDRAFAELLKDRCEDRTLISGVLVISGCLTPLRSAAQLPAAERGSLNPLLDIGRIQSRADIIAGRDAPAGTFVERALDFAGAYTSRGPVLVNGVTWTPQGAGRIVLFPQVRRIFSSNATMSVAGIRLDHPQAFSVNTAATNGQSRIPLGSFPRLPGGTRTMAGFALAGDVGVVLKAGGGAELTVSLKLPPFLDAVGLSPQDGLKVSVTPEGAASLDGATIGPIDASLGPVGVRDLRLDYTGATREWRGTGELCLEFACLDATERPGQAPPPGGVIIRDGALVRLGANVLFPDPGITLFPGVQLNRIGALVGLDPTRFSGGVGVTAAGIFQIDGTVMLAFPSAATPFTLTREEVGQAFPPEFYARRYTTATMAIGADAYLKVPYIDTRVRLGGAYLLYSAPGYVAFGGGVDTDFFDIVSIEGGASGEFNAANGRFNLAGRVRVCVVDIICAGAVGYVSSAGVGGCVNVDLGFDDVNVGGGVRYSPFDVYVWPFDGCRWTRFAERNVFGASAAQAGRPIEVKLKAGDPRRAIRLDGKTGAPRVRVTTPDGKTLESPAGAGLAAIPALRILRSEQLKATIVGLNDPKPGTYRIEELPGSPQITSSSEAEDQPKARVTASVGPGKRAAKRTLRYDIGKRQDQRVRFVDVGPTGSRELGVVAGGGRGTLTFPSLPGTGVHRVEAQFELAGVQAERLTVARFTPPSPRLARPARVTVRRRGALLSVTWPAVTGAARYEVVATAASGEQRRTRTAKRTITLKGLPTGSGGQVAVRASASLRQGPRTTAVFRATTRRAPTRFGPLPKLRRVR